MRDLPTVETERLILRPLILLDAPEVARLAGERDIAATTLLIPHPYGRRDAEEWITGHGHAFEADTGLSLAIARRADCALVGAVSFKISRVHNHAELGYWIGKPFWNKGYATESGRAMVACGFESLDLHRIHAHHFANNLSSGRVLEKIGLLYEGRLRDHVFKWGEYHDCLLYGLTRAAWR